MAEHPAPTPADPAAPADPAQRARVARGTRIAVVVVLVLLAVGAGRTIVGRMANARVLEANVSEGALQYVKTIVARTSEGGQTLALPGSLQGFQQAPLAARSAGYVKRWTKDIGSHVAKGELLAVIESPEIDQQLSQAEAARGQTAASLGAGEEHGRALGGAAQERRRLAAGARRAAQRPGAGAAPTSPPPTPTCSGCASCRASRASRRRSTASSRAATSTSATSSIRAARRCSC